MGKGGRRTKIPKEVLPNLLKTCIKNYQRLRRDSEILFANKSYPSAVEKLLEASEELSKVVILLPFYKRKADVPEEVVRKIFRDHNYRFQELTKYLHQALPSPMGMDFIENMANMMGNAEQDYKEKMIYVDWIDNKIHDPTYLEQFMITKESDAEEFVKMKYEITKINLNTILQKLSQDPDLQSLLSESDKELPSLFKVNQVLQQYFGEAKVPTKSEIKGKKLTVRLDSKHGLVTEEVRLLIKKHLEAQYPDYEISVKLEDMK